MDQANHEGTVQLPTHGGHDHHIAPQIGIRVEVSIANSQESYHSQPECISILMDYRLLVNPVVALDQV